MSDPSVKFRSYESSKPMNSAYKLLCPVSRGAGTFHPGFRCVGLPYIPAYPRQLNKQLPVFTVIRSTKNSFKTIRLLGLLVNIFHLLLANRHFYLNLLICLSLGF